MENQTKYEKIDTMRMKDIVSQLTDVIYLLCGAKNKDTVIILQQLTNLTEDEYKHLHITFTEDLVS